MEYIKPITLVQRLSWRWLIEQTDTGAETHSIMLRLVYSKIHFRKNPNILRQPETFAIGT
jgi:hypothetical protein